MSSFTGLPACLRLLVGPLAQALAALMASSLHRLALAALLILTCTIVSNSTAAQATVGTFSANMTGNVNGVNFTLNGAGTRDPDLGVVDGEYDISALIPGFDLQLLNAFLITGYPSDARPDPGAINPFRDVSYSYTRTLTFDDGKTLLLQATCTKDGNHITSTFNLTGSAAVPNLVGVDPLQEIWTFPSPGSVHGVFTMVWRIEGGGTLQAVAETDYSIDPNIALPFGSETRDIVIEAQDQGLHLSRHQESVLHAPSIGGLVGLMNNQPLTNASEAGSRDISHALLQLMVGTGLAVFAIGAWHWRKRLQDRSV